MLRRAVLTFLIKAFPLLALMLYVWHARGLSGSYHHLLAGTLTRIYPSLDPAQLVTGVGVEGQMLVVRIVLNGKTYLLDIVAADITSNMTMLLSLYLASPIRRFARRFAVYFAVALGLMFLIHLLTITASIQYACMAHPLIMSRSPFSSLSAKLVPAYVSFYELFGAYLAVLLLWFPYILRYVRWGSRS